MKKILLLVIAIMGMLFLWTAASYAQCAGEEIVVGQVTYCFCGPGCCEESDCDIPVPGLEECFDVSPDLHYCAGRYEHEPYCYIYVPDPNQECDD
jgi:hypothetical protein